MSVLRITLMFHKDIRIFTSLHMNVVTAYMSRNVKVNLNTKLYAIYKILILLLESKNITLYSFEISNHSDIVIHINS